MHLDQSALGILRKAEDKNGRKYMDWRIPYMDQLGLIMVYKSDSRYEKYMIYFFTSPASKCPGKYLHTTYGSIQVEDGSLTIRTKNSVYEFELDASCVSKADMILLLHAVMSISVMMECKADDGCQAAAGAISQLFLQFQTVSE